MELENTLSGEENRTSRRGFLRGVAGLGVALMGSDLYAKDDWKSVYHWEDTYDLDPAIIPHVKIPKYDYDVDKVKKVLGERLDKSFDSYWKLMNNGEKQLMYDSIVKPNDVVKKLPKCVKKKIRKYFNKEDLKGYADFLNKVHKDRFPFEIDYSNLSVSDKLWIYLSEVEKVCG